MRMSECFDPERFVRIFARGMEAADARRPVAHNRLTKAAYGAGLGPHTEDASLRLTIGEIADVLPGAPTITFQIPYPDAPRSKADLRLTWSEANCLTIEAKLFRLLGDNGNPNDNMLMHIMSPYATHRSAVTDVAKLATARFGGDIGILIFGYEAEDYPCELALKGFELLAREHAELGPRHQAWTAPLVHPVHRRGFAAFWQIHRR